MGEALELGLLLAGLYAVARSVHTRESRHLARQVATAVVRYIDGEVRPRLEGGGPAATDCDDSRVLATVLIEARVYRSVRSTIFGRLPMYVLAPDLSLVADPETPGALRCHLDLEPID
ncbi:MAG: hypothetical protein ABFC38_01210 [Methanospirillum sp.]